MLVDLISMTSNKGPTVRFEVDTPGLVVATIELDELKVSQSCPSFEEYERILFDDRLPLKGCLLPIEGHSCLSLLSPPSTLLSRRMEEDLHL